MAPNGTEDLELRNIQDNPSLIGDEVVISGISGIFPSCNNVEDFSNNLYNKVDMVTSNDETWQLNHPQLAKHSGKLTGLNKIDAQFFKVPHGQSEYLDAMTRKLLENTYGALFDAGINPKHVAGTNMGVFTGASFIDIAAVNLYEIGTDSNYLMTGSSKTMMANRISYYLDTKGPSYSLDMTCSSSMGALAHAYRAIKKGVCNSAIVAGSNLCVQQMLTLNLRQAGVLCLDGKTKCFDKNADGYVRSEAVVVLFLQKASDAKRIYSEVLHVKEKYFAKPDSHSLYVRQSDDIELFFREFYSEVDTSPKHVEYLEAFGAGIKDADEKELEAIGNFFAKSGNIKIGCVKSNMGHSEGTSDLCALAKACLAYHKGELPGNLHYNNPQDHIPAVKDGSIQILTETTPFQRGYTAINSFSYSGVNYHALFKGHYKRKNLEKYNSSIPRLVLASGRTESGVSKIMDYLKNHPVDAELIALLNDFFATDISGHTYRGYLIIDSNDKNETVSLVESTDHYPGTKPPVCFLYSGMGSQWPGMGVELMKIPAFAASIERCHEILLPKGIDLMKIITSSDKSVFDNILNSFVGIAAIQIALTDLLTEMGIVPNIIIGHSLGELGCAYADGCFTAEEMMLFAYCRGVVAVETKFIDGLMAAVGLGHKEVSPICPPEIEIACHNSSSSCTISGPANIVRKFVKTLRSQNIFAKEVQTANIAFHSKYVAEAGPRFLSSMKEVVNNPRQRSDKWLCTCASPKNWNQPETKYASAEYFTKNFLNNVYFEEAAKMIPKNAIVIEIAPHGLMQAIVVNSHESCMHIPLTRRGHSDPVKFLLEAVGKMFQGGLNPQLSFMYPKVEYPVSTETSLLSPLVGWAHIEDWAVATYNKQDTDRVPARKFAMSINDDDWSYLKGHVRNGATIFPEAALLVLVWETFAMYKGLDYRNMSVIFEDVRFEKEILIKNKEVVRFNIEIQAGCCLFEINNNGSVIATGFIKKVHDKDINLSTGNENVCDDMVLTSKDVYTLLGVRGYSYTGVFQSILSSNTKRNMANIKWSNEWVSFLDSLIQLNALSRVHDGISIPKFIRKLSINTAIHEKVLADERDFVSSFYDCIRDLTRSGGVRIDNIIFKDKPSVEKEWDILKSMKFIPHFPKGIMDIQTALTMNLQIVAENITTKPLNVVEIIKNCDNNKFSNIVNESAKYIFPNIDVHINCIHTDYGELNENVLNSTIGIANLLILRNVMNKDMILKNISGVLRNNSFVLAIEENNFSLKSYEEKYFKVITLISTGQSSIILLRKTTQDKNTIYVEVNDNDFSWIPHVKKELESQKKVMLVSHYKKSFGLKGFVAALRKDGVNNIGLILINDLKVPQFSSKASFYKEQIEKNLTYNLFDQGYWGGNYYLPALNDESSGTLNVTLTTKNIEGIEGLKWKEIPIVPCKNNLVLVNYAGPSLYDFQKALGTLKDDNNNFGMDFSGYNTRGERVMGLVSSGALSSTLESDPALIWPIPEHWSLEDAATIPLSYVHAYYCLMIRNKLQEKDSVLVLGGAGALGQAIISICLDLNCTVYSTVSSEEKKQFLLKLFPKLKGEHITSGPHNVHNMVSYHANKELLCNYVISCAQGDLRELAMKCVGSLGTFVDVSDYDKEDNKEWGLSFLMKNRSYKSLNVSSIFKMDSLQHKKDLHKLVSDGLASGVVRPLTRTVFSRDNISKAFRFLSSRQRIGKVLVNMTSSASFNKQLDQLTRVSFTMEGTCLVICGETILGVELVGWLIKQGVKKIIIHQKSNMGDAYSKAKSESWKKCGVLSSFSVENLQTSSGCAALLNECEKIGPLQGIFIVQNTDMKSQNHCSIHEIVGKQFKENVTIVANVDKASKEYCQNLRHFVVIAPSTGNVSGECVASATENICENRTEKQLPALLMRTDIIHKINDNLDVLPGELSSFFYALEKSMKNKYSNVITSSHENRVSMKVVNIIGKSNVETIEKTLDELHNPQASLDENGEYLNKTMNLNGTTEELKWISNRRNLRNYTSSAGGFGAFFNYIERDEIQASEPIVIMPTKLGNCTNKALGELIAEESHLIMIPGFEGNSHIFSSMGERLKIQAASLQLSPDLVGDSIPEMASMFFKHIKNTFEFETKFYILGYSFGINIALEIAALLEKEGHLGIVFCLDSSPEAVKVHLDTYLGKLTDSELQNSIITHTINLLSGEDIQNISEELNNLGGWQSKVEYCLKTLKKSVSYSHQYLKSTVESIYNRIILARAYEPDLMLESKLVLIKGTGHPNAEYLADDYNLSKYTKQPVTIFHIDSDHPLAPYDCDIPNLVNKMLEPKLLDQYKNHNMCEIYSNVAVRVKKTKDNVEKV